MPDISAGQYWRPIIRTDGNVFQKVRSFRKHAVSLVDEKISVLFFNTIRKVVSIVIEESANSHSWHRKGHELKVAVASRIVVDLCGEYTVFIVKILENCESSIH